MLKPNSLKYFDEVEFQRRITLALDWLEQSMAVHNFQGSAASFHCFKGWRKPYPETTGYLIPTLLNLSPLFPDRPLKTYADNCVDWLMQIQNTDGTFNGGLSDQPPIVFDMAQILLGLCVYYRKYPSEALFITIEKTCIVLLENMTPIGQWDKWSYKSGFTPMYYTRVIWH